MLEPDLESILLEAPALLAAAFGLLIGSFLNVVIYRMPRDLSIVRPRSHCPECETMIPAWDNIPLLSYLILRGKCRNCRTPIPFRYPLVEALTAILFGWFVATHGLTFEALRDCVLSALFLALIFTDLETRLLPEPLTIGGIAAGLAFSLLTPVHDGTASAFGLHGRTAAFADSAFGAFLPAFLLWGTGWLFEKIRHKQGLGFGDVVMISEVGAFLGLRSAFLTLVVASIAGSIVGTAFILQSKKDAWTYELPLGSFLGAAGILVAAFGQRFTDWYANLF